MIGYNGRASTSAEACEGRRTASRELLDGRPSIVMTSLIREAIVDVHLRVSHRSQLRQNRGGVIRGAPRAKDSTVLLAHRLIHSLHRTLRPQREAERPRNDAEPG